ncbi:MAG: hypothetical protein R2881_01370 [Eubacteriales bacterium]
MYLPLKAKYADFREANDGTHAQSRGLENGTSICFLTAAVFLFLVRYSPLYPLNEWVDANIYFTIGKA